MAKPAPRTAAWFDLAARGLLTAWIALIVFPVRWHAIQAGLDASWAFALNWCAAHGLRHGRDVAWTYGPLSYLVLPMDVGANLVWGMLFQLVFWLLFAATAAWIAFVRRVPLARLAVFTVLCAYGAPLFHDFAFAGPDLFLGFWVLLLLGCTVEGRRWSLFYALAVAAATLLMFVKLSSGFSALSAAGLFAAGLFTLDRARARRAVLMAACAPVLFAILYLLYCPSPEALVRYTRAAMDIASGHGAAMSQGEDASALRAALCIAAAHAALIAVLWVRRQPAAVLAIAVTGPLFLEFKHSFVRQSGHVGLYFALVPLTLGVVLLFTNFRRKDWWAVAAPAALMLAFWHPQRLPANFGWTNLSAMATLAHFPELRARLAEASRASLAGDRLPTALLARIGGASVTVMPWEASYAAANPLNYRPLPIFANHQAYTPFLDGWNAEALADPARAPQYVIFDWVAIDDRHPTLEVPATALALYQYYDVDNLDPGRLLFRRRAAPRFTRLAFRGTRQLSLKEPLRLEDRGHPVVARIRLQLSWGGRARRFLYRVPEVRAILFSEAGHSIDARVPPDVLEGGVAINFTPASAAEAAALFQRNEAGDTAVALSLAGPGLAAYEPVYAADLYEIPEIALAKPAPQPGPAALPYRGEVDGGRIESLNGRGVLDYGPNEVVEIDSPGYLRIQGWAVDDAGAAGGVWIELDGRLYPARYGLPRPDIAALRGGPGWRDCGFEWTVPEWRLGAGTHQLALKVISRDGSAWYAPPRKLRFRLTGWR